MRETTYQRQCRLGHAVTLGYKQTEQGIKPILKDMQWLKNIGRDSFTGRAVCACCGNLKPFKVTDGGLVWRDKWVNGFGYVK